MYCSAHNYDGGPGTIPLSSYFCAAGNCVTITSRDIKCEGWTSASTCPTSPNSWNIDIDVGTNGHDYDCPSGGTLSGTTCSYTP